MASVGSAYLQAASAALVLLRRPEVAAAWDKPSALPEFRVGGLAGHLARQVLRVPLVLEAAPPAQAVPRSLLDHYTGSSWVAASIDDEVNVAIRRDGEKQAAAGPAGLAARVEVVLAVLRESLAAGPSQRVVHLPWTRWSLTLDDFLVTRMLEISVHSDDLAVSVGVPTPSFPATVIDPVLALLTQLASVRHGPVAVLRALSRAERAPASIAAI